MGNFATFARGGRVLVPFEHHRKRTPGAQHFVAAPPVRRCPSCGRDRWWPGETATCPGCVLDASVAARNVRRAPSAGPYR